MPKKKEPIIATEPETPAEKAAVAKIVAAKETAKEDLAEKKAHRFVVVDGGTDIYIVRDRDYFTDIRVYKKAPGCEDPKAAAESYARKMNSL